MLLPGTSEIKEEEKFQKQNYTGAPIGENVLLLPRRLNKVANICIGEKHMIVQGIDQFTQQQLVYGMGDNTWGQIGKDPHEVLFQR